MSDIIPGQCQIHDALSVLSGKWNLIILLQLFSEPMLRFSELKRRIPGITQKMLTSKLRELETEGIVSRKVYPQVPPKVEYSITEYGETLRPILNAMHDWGQKHNRLKQSPTKVKA